VTQLCRAQKIRQIGNVVDWVASQPDVFVGSAMANVGMGVYQAVKDMQSLGAPKAGIQKIGLSFPGAVQLSMAADVPAAVRQKIEQARLAIIAGTLKVPEDYSGPEFANPV
jgi:basic membrane protein A